MNLLKTLHKAAKTHAYGEYKIVTRTAHKRGCAVYKRYSLADAQQVAELARESGMTAQIYVEGKEGWQEVDR